MTLRRGLKPRRVLANIRRLIGFAAILGCATGVAAVSSCHSTAFTTTGYLVDTVRVRGAMELLTADSMTAEPSWTPDGKGIEYQFRLRPPLMGDIWIFHKVGIHVDTVLLDRQDWCTGLLPGSGGSRVWTLCDTRFAHWDSTDVFSAVAVAPDGRLIYQEATGRVDFPLPVGYHIELWLADTARPFQRTRLLTLYSDSAGIAHSQQGQINWLDGLAWSGPDRWIAMGYHLDPDSTLTPLGLVVGSAAPSGGMPTLIPGTAAARRFSTIPGSGDAAFVNASSTIYRASSTAGTAVLLATIQDSNATALDISCGPATCRILTQRVIDSVFARGKPTPAVVEHVWSVEIASGAASLTSTFVGTRAFDQASLAPIGKAIAGRSGSELYLIPR